MPSVSKAQERAAQMAEHASPEQIASAGPAVKQMTKQMAASMLRVPLADLAVGSEKGKPEHVKHKKHHAMPRHGRQPKMRGA